MSHVLTETAAQGGAVTVPDPGDARTAASVVSPIQTLANRIKYQELWADGGAGFNAAVSMPITGAAFDALVGGAWIFAGQVWIQSDVAAAAALSVDLRLPHGALLQSVHAQIRGNGGGAGNHSAVPATKPTLTIYELDPLNENNVTYSSTVTDPSGTQAVYDAKHNIDVNGINRTINSGLKYRVKLTGETGTNSLALRLVWYALLVDWAPAT